MKVYFKDFEGEKGENEKKTAATEKQKVLSEHTLTPKKLATGHEKFPLFFAKY